MLSRSREKENKMVALAILEILGECIFILTSKCKGGLAHPDVQNDLAKGLVRLANHVLRHQSESVRYQLKPLLRQVEELDRSPIGLWDRNEAFMNFVREFRDKLRSELDDEERGAALQAAIRIGSADAGAIVFGPQTLKAKVQVVYRKAGGGENIVTEEDSFDVLSTDDPRAIQVKFGKYKEIKRGWALSNGHTIKSIGITSFDNPF